MDLYELRQQYKAYIETFNGLKKHIDIDALRHEVKDLEQKMQADGFWNDQRQAKKIIDQTNRLKSIVETFDDIESQIGDIEAGIELFQEEDEMDIFQELQSMVVSLGKTVSSFETKLLLSGEHDHKNAILELHPVGGGTESQDWGSILMRMYIRYAESKGFKVEVLDYLDGEDAGIKSVTLLIKGENAYGYLKAEKGVHRLVRISPFDSSGRRHTSFVSCDVTPEMDEDIDIEINPEDLKIDTYRSSGAGGQHVNTTDSAVRITHIPTGVVVSCQAERSQIQNRERAMKMLKAKLYQLKLEEQQKKLDALRGEQKDIGWGSQIRSYVFHPYSMVKDHRTNSETSNIQAVVDGEIEPFILEYLRSQISID
mgnify:CR=1 FL=1